MARYARNFALFPMVLLLFCIVWLQGLRPGHAAITDAVGNAAGSTITAQIVIPPNQLSSAPFRVLITRNIPSDSMPKLIVRDAGDVQGNTGTFSPMQTMPGASISVPPPQGSTESITASGTLLLFDVNSLGELAHPAHMYFIALEWTENGVRYTALPSCNCAVKIINRNGVIVWTLVATGSFIGLMLFVTWMARKNAARYGLVVGVLCDDDGRVSLSRFQMMLWTVIIGGVVFSFSLIHREMITLSPTLIVLMGLSYVTTALSAGLPTGSAGTGAAGTGAATAGEGATDTATTVATITDPTSATATIMTTSTTETAPAGGSAAPVVAASVTTPVTTAPAGPVAAAVALPDNLARAGGVAKFFLDMISLPSATGAPNPGVKISIARTQMLFWTFIIAAIFIYKYAVSGIIWDVPWEIIALMGVSQSGYLSKKIPGTTGW